MRRGPHPAPTGASAKRSSLCGASKVAKAVKSAPRARVKSAKSPTAGGVSQKLFASSTSGEKVFASRGRTKVAKVGPLRARVQILLKPKPKLRRLRESVTTNSWFVTVCNDKLSSTGRRHVKRPSESKEHATLDRKCPQEAVGDANRLRATKHTLFSVLLLRPARPYSGRRAFTAAFAASLAGLPYKKRRTRAGSAPLSSAEVRVAQPASVIWVLLR